MISQATKEARKQYIDAVKETLQKIDNDKFEKLIKELFEKNGHTCTNTHWYDKKGGDVDLVFEGFGKNTLMYNIYDICDEKMPFVYVQAKKKTGNDREDRVGVSQLLKMKEYIPKENAVMIVINLTEEFSDEAKAQASENGIILINGATFASLLVRYGIDVDIG
jgi:restriction endonuclease Mrr